MWLLRRVVVLLALAAAWWGASRWWRAASDPPDVPSPATPWPPATTPVARPAELAATDGPAVGEAGPDAEVPVARAVEQAAVEELAVGEAGGAWVAPVDGGCPDGYPVKAKLRSRLYHLPGMVAYARTGPDRCYPTAEAAEADGFTRARR